MLKKIFISASLILVLIFTIFIIGNNYNMREEKVSISTKNNKLSGIITFPKKEEVKGIIIFVHGDGSQNATLDDGYKPLMEVFANEGYASISWDKPGVGDSTGNWLNQSMSDRADEVEDVINWVKIRYPDLINKIGLWGSSQAGWVIPKVIKNTDEIDFSIVVAPGVNWISQGEHYTIEKAKSEGKSSKEIKKIRENFYKDVKLIEENESYNKYKQSGGDEDITSDRYEFIRKNMSSDSTEDLKDINSKVYLVLAEYDKNVDSSEAQKVYSNNIDSKFLETKMINNTEHMMINPSIGGSEVLTNIVAVMLPKILLVSKDYLDYCKYIVSSQ